MYRNIKRIIDFIVALIILILGCIPMIIVAIMIRVESKGPIIYKSKRMGKDLKPFDVYKFRSMVAERKELQTDLKHEDMVTKVGKFIRKTSLDELPQLFNILKGEMSFIGPRPWILEYYEIFTDKQKNRTNVLPGISGLAQAKGRNGLNIFKKIEYDLEYVNNISLKEDIKIILLTIKTVLSKSDAEITESGIKDELVELKEKNYAKEDISRQYEFN